MLKFPVKVAITPNYNQLTNGFTRFVALLPILFWTQLAKRWKLRQTYRLIDYRLKSMCQDCAMSLACTILSLVDGPAAGNNHKIIWITKKQGHTPYSAS